MSEYNRKGMTVAAWKDLKHCVNWVEKSRDAKGKKWDSSGTTVAGQIYETEVIDGSAATNWCPIRAVWLGRSNVLKQGEQIYIFKCDGVQVNRTSEKNHSFYIFICGSAHNGFLGVSQFVSEITAVRNAQQIPNMNAKLMMQNLCHYHLPANKN